MQINRKEFLKDIEMKFQECFQVMGESHSEYNSLKVVHLTYQLLKNAVDSNSIDFKTKGKDEHFMSDKEAEDFQQLKESLDKIFSMCIEEQTCH